MLLRADVPRTTRVLRRTVPGHNGGKAEGSKLLAAARQMVRRGPSIGGLPNHLDACSLNWIQKRPSEATDDSDSCWRDAQRWDVRAQAITWFGEVEVQRTD